MTILSKLFTWWNGPTLGTALFTRRHGKEVGQDSKGNVYYQSEDGSRRWVIYNGEVEATRIDASWHGWLHHTWQEPPTDAPPARNDWELPHAQNGTGGPDAYRPAGSMLSGNAAVVEDYEAWSPAR